MPAESKNRNAVRFRVTRHLPLGLFVELEDGRNGIIRVREISWDPQERCDWQQRYPLDYSGWAVSLEKNETGHLELSLRQVQDNPWEQVAGQLKNGQVLEGTVSGALGYGAFVELASGLTGLLHRQNFPEWLPRQAAPTELFWPGDQVRVVIRDFDLSQRRISLGLAHRQASESPTVPRDMSRPPQPGAGISHRRSLLDKFLQEHQEKKHILIIEDEHDQAGVVASWLKHIGQRVDVADTSMAALELLERDPPDIALVDLGLPDLNGLELIRQTQERWPQVHLVLTTDWARADEYMREIEGLQAAGVGLLIKPLLPEDLPEILAPARRRPGAPEEPQTGLGNDFPLLERARSPQANTIRELVRQCQATLGFETAVLFSLDPAQRSVDVVHKSGDGLAHKEALKALIYSPVRDIAEDGDVVAMEHLSRERHDQFRYLLEYYPLEACLGLPVPGNFPLQYALVLMDTHPRHITTEMKTYASATALAIGAILERIVFQEQTVLIQRTALMGHLTRALVHEVNNLIGRLMARLDKLESELGRMLQEPAGNAQEMRQNAAQAGASLAEVQTNVDAIAQSTRMFARIITKSKNEALRVDEIIYEAIHLLHDQAVRANVSIDFTPPTKMVLVRTQAAALEQIFLNLILNAVQQIAELRQERGGWVKVRIEIVSSQDGAAQLRVLVEDNGPGIHRRLWEQIFEAGYTTRQDGSGMGLYISRGIVESLGGRLYVAKSYIFGGTTFALELPGL